MKLPLSSWFGTKCQFSVIDQILFSINEKKKIIYFFSYNNGLIDLDSRMQSSHCICKKYSKCNWIVYMSSHHSVERVQIMQLPGCHNLKCLFFCNQDKNHEVVHKIWDFDTLSGSENCSFVTTID